MLTRRPSGAPSIGFNIALPIEQISNPYVTPELDFRFHYFATRKMHLAMRANALAIFPAASARWDELFELLTLQQTRKAPPAVLFGEAYWRRIVNFEALVEEGMISAGDLNLFDYADSAEAGWEKLVRRGAARPCAGRRLAPPVPRPRLAFPQCCDTGAAGG
jgi:predicted Rossmann-fold nucleotide-binding protein